MTITFSTEITWIQEEKIMSPIQKILYCGSTQIDDDFQYIFEKNRFPIIRYDVKYCIIDSTKHKIKIMLNCAVCMEYFPIFTLFYLL